LHRDSFRKSSVDDEHVAVVDACIAPGVTDRAHHEGRLRVPDQGIVQVDALAVRWRDSGVGIRLAELDKKDAEGLLAERQQLHDALGEMR
jgi:hypothetical protein